jgi:outer membrane protein W
LVRHLILFSTLVGLVNWGTAQAEQADADKCLLFSEKHQAGIRLGVWANNGESPTDSMGVFETNFKDASFFFEGYFAYRLAPIVMLELSFGIVNRGSVTFREAGATNVGNVLVHPILLQLKLYPLASLATKFQPYLLAGGGLYYGHRSVQFTTSSDVYYYGLAEQSGTDFNYVLGGGVDWPLSATIGLEVGAKYMPIEFSKRLQTVRDYDAVAFTVGVKYLYSSKKP